MKRSASSIGCLCLLLLVCVCALGGTLVPTDETACIGPAELLEIALDGKDPSALVVIAWDKLNEETKISGPLDTFHSTIVITHHEEGMEPTLDVLLERNEEVYTVVFSIGLFDVLYCVVK